MTLASHFPVLDDRRFDDLVAEAKARIPRYTPEWTDYNPGDPGFALVELFAWMTELTLFRLNQVPRLNYLKFLAMMGIEPRPAQSARTIVLMPVMPSFAHLAVLLPAGTQIATAEPDGDGRPIVFETDRALTALRAVLGAVQIDDGYGQTLASAANADLTSGFAPFGPLATPGAALMLGFEDSAELPADAEISLGVWPLATERGYPVEACTGDDAGPPPPALIKWEFWAGFEWRPLTVLADETRAFSRTGTIRLRLPPAGQIVKSRVGVAQDRPRSWLRARLDKSFYQRPPLLAGVRLNAVHTLEAQSVRDEIIGGSDGTADQTFTFANSPVLSGSLEIDVYETETPERWRLVDDFFGQGADAPVYCADWSSGTVRFAGVNRPHDGTGGRIPSANVARAQTGIVARSYRFGGGTRGNVAAGAISVPLTVVQGLDVNRVGNPVAAAGGADEEDIDTLIARAARILKARDRAVTPGDFELLALESGAVARALAMPLAHPDFPGLDVPGTVTLLVLPTIPGDRAAVLAQPAPRPAQSLLREVCAWLDQRRLLGTELFVRGPQYAQIELTLTLIVDPDADAADVVSRATDALRAWFHPLIGGSDGGGWPFGGAVRYAELYRAALIDGVRRVEGIEIVRGGEPFGMCQDVPIPAGALVDLKSLAIGAIEDGQ